MQRKEILAKLAAGEISLEEADRLLAELGAESPTLTCKVSPKRAVSVYGLQRMPVTLYADQWFRLLDFGNEIRAFIQQHRTELRWRERSEPATVSENSSSAGMGSGSREEPDATALSQVAQAEANPQGQLP